MKTDEQIEDLVEGLYGAASEGDVAEVLVVYRDQSGDLRAGYAARDRDALFDEIRTAMAQLETSERGRLH